MIIKNGLVATATGMRKASILITAGKIAKISPSLPSRGEETIDATGLAVLPGLVDCHVHFRDPGSVAKEDFYSGTCSALAGGVATVIDMPNNNPPTTTLEALREKRKIAQAKAVCDYALHFGATNENVAEAKKAGADNAVSSLKFFLGSSTGDLLGGDAAFHAHCAQFNPKKPVCIHAEDEEMIRYKAGEYKKRFPRIGVKIHNVIRSPLASETAVVHALSAATESKRKIHLCHVSTQGELRQIVSFRKKGARASCEATPHHLFLSEENLGGLGNYGKVNPPLRGRQDQIALWKAIANGTVDCVASDHAPHLKEEKRKIYWDAPSGVPGVETTLPLMLTAVAQKKISLQKLVQLCSYNPARIFNLKTKGEIAVGKDADFALVDLKKKHKISADKLHSRCGWTAFEGFAAVGSVEKTILRGKLAFDGENTVLKPGEGMPAKIA